MELKSLHDCCVELIAYRWRRPPDGPGAMIAYSSEIASNLLKMPDFDGKSPLDEMTRGRVRLMLDGIKSWPGENARAIKRRLRELLKAPKISN